MAQEPFNGGIALTTWVVRAGEEGEDEQAAWDHSVITIGWNELPDLSCLSKQEITELGDERYSRYHPPTATFQMWKFVHEIKIGDWIVIPCINKKFKDFIAVGEVIANYEFREVAPDIIHSRRVKWIKLLPRPLDPDIRKYFGSELTVHRLNSIAERYIIDILSKSAKPL